MITSVEETNDISHELVPKHEILSDKEKKEVLEKFGVNEKQMPVIWSSDPVAESIGSKPGDLLRITRKSATAGEAVYYRVVVEK